MPTIWDLMPASMWPTQRFIPPDEQMQTLLAAAQHLQAPWDWSSRLSKEAAPRDMAFTPSTPPQELFSATPGRDDSSSWTPGPRSFDAGGILGPAFGSKADIPREVYRTSAKAPFPATQYGVIPKNFPQELMPPRRVSDWQRPESDFDVDSPQTRAQAEKALAASLNPNEIILNDPAARARRETARAADLLMPGSGNFVSGDWNNISPDDVAKLALSVALTVGPGVIGSAAARAGAAGVFSRIASSGQLNPASVLDRANFAQRWFSPRFGGGPLAGKTIEEVANALRSGLLKPNDLEVQYIVQDGHTLMLNTRTAQALEQARIPRSEWKVVNKTGDIEAEERLSDQLRRNRLTNEGISTVMPKSKYLEQGIGP